MTPAETERAAVVAFLKQWASIYGSRIPDAVDEASAALIASQAAAFQAVALAIERGDHPTQERDADAENQAAITAWAEENI